MSFGSVVKNRENIYNCSYLDEISLSGLFLRSKISNFQKSLSKIETGRNFLTSETLEKLTLALNVEITELFDFNHTDKKENLLDEIYKYIDNIKNNEKDLITLYKIVQALGKK